MLLRTQLAKTAKKPTPELIKTSVEISKVNVLKQAIKKKLTHIIEQKPASEKAYELVSELLVSFETLAQEIKQVEEKNASKKLDFKDNELCHLIMLAFLELYTPYHTLQKKNEYLCSFIKDTDSYSPSWCYKQVWYGSSERDKLKGILNEDLGKVHSKQNLIFLYLLPYIKILTHSLYFIDHNDKKLLTQSYTHLVLGLIILKRVVYETKEADLKFMAHILETINITMKKPEYYGYELKNPDDSRIIKYIIKDALQSAIQLFSEKALSASMILQAPQNNLAFDQIAEALLKDLEDKKTSIQESKSNELLSKEKIEYRLFIRAFTLQVTQRERLRDIVDKAGQLTLFKDFLSIFTKQQTFNNINTYESCRDANIAKTMFLIGSECPVNTDDKYAYELKSCYHELIKFVSIAESILSPKSPISFFRNSSLAPRESLSARIKMKILSFAFDEAAYIAENVIFYGIERRAGFIHQDTTKIAARITEKYKLNAKDFITTEAAAILQSRLTNVLSKKFEGNCPDEVSQSLVCSNFGYFAQQNISPTEKEIEKFISNMNKSIANMVFMTCRKALKMLNPKDDPDKKPATLPMNFHFINFKVRETFANENYNGLWINENLMSECCTKLSEYFVKTKFASKHIPYVLKPILDKACEARTRDENAKAMQRLR